ncbi:MAG: M43 family zinc metalloprotease [Bacteroidota bacterium]
MRVYLLSLLIVLLSVEGSVSQTVTRSCGTSVLYPPSFQQGHATSIPVRQEQFQEPLSFPVIVHIIHSGESRGVGRNISSAQIYSQIEVLNEDLNRQEGSPGFNDHPIGASLDISFTVALQDTCQNSIEEAGVDRIDIRERGFLPPPYTRSYLEQVILPATSWDPTRYLNIWVCELANGIQGIAQFPDASGLLGIPAVNGSPNTDGIIVDYQSFGRVGNVIAPFDQGRTATHEIGHWLGLIHTWGDGGCANDDFCEDTPLSDTPTSGCPVNKQSCGSADMIENYMDFTDDACMNIFTMNQRDRVLQVLANSPRRIILSESTVDVAPDVAPMPEFIAVSTQVCPGTTVQFTDKSKGNPVNWKWIFEGGIPAESSEPNPLVTYETEGNYSVSLRVDNAFGEGELIQNGLMEVSASLNSAVLFSEDFENDLVGWTIQNPDGADSWELAFVGGSRSGSAVAALRHYDYLARGERDKLISPLIDLSLQDSPVLQLDYAYQRFGIDRQDSLYISLVEEGGDTTLLLALGEGEDGGYATAGESKLAFFPRQEQEWCFGDSSTTDCIEIDLSPFAGREKVRLVLETVNDFGNNLFIDNIRVLGNCSSSVTSLNPLVEEKSLHIYPNPCQGDCWISVPFGLDSSIEMEIIDIQGNSLFSGSWPYPHPPRIPIPVQQLTSGIYLLIFHVGSFTYTEKLLIY